METLRLGGAGTARLLPFVDLDQCAAMTVAYLHSGTVALSGGSTFAGLYPRWLRMDLGSTTATFFPVDERIVPFDDPRSNWGTAYRQFLLPLGRGDQRSHAADSREAYERTLHRHFRSPDPVFDTIFLGVGDDGHTASLFPGDAGLSDTTSVVLRTRSPKPPHERITLGLRPLFRARRLVVVIAGAGKETVVAGLRSGEDSLPVTRVLAGRKDSLVLVHADLSAAG